MAMENVVTKDPPETASGRGDIPFISLLRGLACLLVVWDHLVATWNDNHGTAFAPLTYARAYINTPLAIIQDFGYLGVALFFLVSGFIITHVAQRESHLAFFVKRALRIYPPLIVSTLVILLLYKAYAGATGTANTLSGMSAADAALSMTLLNYFIIPQKIVNGVAWTLVIEVMFYLLCLLLLPLLRRRPALASALISLASLAGVHFSRRFGDVFFLVAASGAFIPVLLIGQATFLVSRKGISPMVYLFLLALNASIFAYALQTIHTSFYRPENSYGVSTVYAYLLFVIAMLLGSKARPPGVIAFYSKISYSLYLYHGMVGFVLLEVLFPRIGYPLALPVTFVAATIISYLSWRLVEVPSQAAARALLNGICRRRYALATAAAAESPKLPDAAAVLLEVAAPSE